MELYIEYVILDNYVIDYIILKLIEISTGYNIFKINKFLVCGLGIIFAIFLPFIFGYKWLLFVYRFVVSIILVMCIKKYKKFRSFLIYYSLFFVYTFLIGGSVMGLIQMLNIEYSMSGLFVYNFEFPLGLFGLIVLLFSKIIMIFIKILKKKLSQSNFIYNIILCDGDKKVQTTAFLDTGNNVKSGENGVSIISINLFLKLHSNIDICHIITRNIDGNLLKNMEYIDISGIGETEKYLSFEINSIELGGKEYRNQRIAVAYKNFGDYDCILYKDFVKG